MKINENNFYIIYIVVLSDLRLYRNNNIFVIILYENE